MLNKVAKKAALSILLHIISRENGLEAHQNGNSMTIHNCIHETFADEPVIISNFYLQFPHLHIEGYNFIICIIQNLQIFLIHESSYTLRSIRNES